MLEGLTAFVTGGSRGIGEEIAVAMADEGANVALAARSEGIYSTADRIGDETRTLPIETDVTEESSIQTSIEATVESFGGLDCLVNNAGIPGPYGPSEEVEREEWDHVLSVNATGAFLCAKHAIPHLRASEQASIVNIASMQGKKPVVRAIPYAAAKMAMIGMGRSLAFELGDDDITVNTVCPGATEGDRIEGVIQGRADDFDITYEQSKWDLYVGDTALGTLVNPETIAALCVYLASEHGRHITAQDLNVTAGSTYN